MFKKFAIACAMLLSVPLLSHAADWRTQEVGPHYSVDFPGQPTKVSKPRVNAYTYQGKESGDGYSVVAALLALPNGAITDQKDAEEAYEGAVESLEKRGKIESNTSVEVNGRQGRRIEIRREDDATISAIFVVDGTYFLNVQFLTDSNSDSAAITQVKDRVFESIRLPQGAAQMQAAENQRKAETSDLPDPRKLGIAIGRYAGILLMLGGAIFVMRKIFRPKAKA